MTSNIGCASSEIHAYSLSFCSCFRTQACAKIHERSVLCVVRQMLRVVYVATCCSSLCLLTCGCISVSSPRLRFSPTCGDATAAAS